jgi:hypothetical protein
MTGHKRIICVLLPLAIIYVSGCGDLFEWDHYGNKYGAEIYNNTDDTLLLSLYKGQVTTDNHINEWILFPDSFIYAGGPKVEKGDDPIENYFDDLPSRDTIWVYYLDKEMQNIAQYDTILNEPVYPDSSSFLTIWTGPLKHLSDSIHRFNNYNSWEVIKEDKIIRFTIHEIDIERWDNNQN